MEMVSNTFTAASLVIQTTSVMLGLQNNKSDIFDYRIQNPNRTFEPDNTGEGLKYNKIK